MRHWLSALALVGALTAAPLASAQTVGVPLQVRTGEVYTVYVEQTQTMDLAGQDMTVTAAQTHALHIVDADARIWRYMPASLAFTMPSTPAVDAAAAQIDWTVVSEMASALMRMATDIGIECEVDQYGRCVDMRNWPVWRTRVENMVLMADAVMRLAPQRSPALEADQTQESPDAAKPDDTNADDTDGMQRRPAMRWADYREPVLAGLARVLDGIDNRDAAASMASIELASGVQGRALTRRQAVPVSEDMEMPFGAPPVRFTGTMRLERIDRRANTGLVVRRVALDRDSVRASLQAVTQFLDTNMIGPVARAAAAEGSEPPDMGETVQALLDAVEFSYQETTTGTVDLATGWARETITDVTFSMTPPGGETPIVMNARTVTRISPGAPEIARLPRG